MKTSKSLMVIGVLIVLSGCAIKQLGYFQVEPYSKPFTNKIDTPISIVLMDDLKNNLTVEGVGVKEMPVTEFRRSFGESMKKNVGEKL